MIYFINVCIHISHRVQAFDEIDLSEIVGISRNNYRINR